MATVVSKRYDAAAAKMAPGKLYSLDEAVEIIKSMPPAKFDQSVDLSFRLGVDPKHADQMVRGAVVLPHGIGKTVRVAVFAKGEKEREARGIVRLPATQAEALDALEADSVLMDALGPVLAGSYLAVRRSEWEAYSAGDEAFEQAGHFSKY